MPRISDFDRFLADQKADKARFGDLSERKAQWIGKVDALYRLVRALLQPYQANGSMDFALSVSDIHEEEIGNYQARSLTINLGASSVRFVPVGTMLLGSPGRVDLVGLRGSVRFVLVLPDMDRPMRMAAPLGAPLDLTTYVWKISTQPPGIRYSSIDTASLQSAIMEAADGHSRHR